MVVSSGVISTRKLEVLESEHFRFLWTLVKTRLSQLQVEGEEHTNLDACSCALLFA